MEDERIIDLYWSRSEEAISRSDEKYGRYCGSIAAGILSSREDREECVSDTWLRAWNVMPPQRPNRLAVFFGKITRNLSLDRWRRNHADKRVQMPLALEELGDCIPAADPSADLTESLVVIEALNRFLEALPKESRVLFLQRYWYWSSIKDIAADCGMTESKVKMVLMRARNALRQQLEREGVVL